jgi:2'-5' RNA ligase
VGKTARLFIALELSPQVRDAIRPSLTEIQAALPARMVRWIPLENIHLTLKFLGDVPYPQIKAISEALNQAVEEGSPLKITIQHMGVFPNYKRPSIVWLGLSEPTGLLALLQKRIEQVIAPLGYPTEKRPFSPHLTIGRVQKSLNPDQIRRLGTGLQTLELGHIAEWPCAGVSLMESDLRPDGAQYTRRAWAELSMPKPYPKT